MESKRLEIYEVGPCKDGYEMGLFIAQRFSKVIKSRLQNDVILQQQLQSKPLLSSLIENNQNKYPNDWDELKGSSNTPFLELMLVNLRKENLPFVSDGDDGNEDCILVVCESMIAVAEHHEDANVALLLSNGGTFAAYTYAGELPTCAVGFNTHGLVFSFLKNND